LATAPEKRILIAGATSAIATETARVYASQGARLFLLGRNEPNVKALADDLRVRGAAEVAVGIADLNHFSEHAKLIEQAFDKFQGLDLALICHGSLPDQQNAELNFELTHKEIETNGISVISLLTELSRHFAEQQHGTIAVITSVAGDRGRRSNYIYGAAKAMVSTYLEGLRGRLLSHNVHVVDIKPGFVDSPMTARFEKGRLWSSPQLIAQLIVQGIRKQRHTVYAPFYWRFILLGVKLVPEFVFKHLKLYAHY
jgi:short-subunit dehydrogenase